MTDTIQVSGPAKSSESRVIQLDRVHRDLYAHPPDGVNSWQQRLLCTLSKESAAVGDTEQSSKQGDTDLGEQPWPFDLRAVKDLRTQNAHHSSCINTKVQATVGLGLQWSLRPPTDEELRLLELGAINKREFKRRLRIPNPAYSILDKLCDVSFQNVLHPIGEDFVEAGTGYFEAVRANGVGPVVGLHHLPSRHVRVAKESRFDYHYVIQSFGPTSGFDTRFARFGDLDAMAARLGLSAKQRAETSEVIAIPQSSTFSRYYGFPDWLAAVPPIEVVQMHRQYHYDYFNNRGVPEFMGLFIGPKLRDEEWSEIKQALKATIGTGNTHKSIVSNLECDPTALKVQFERLGMEGNASSEGVFAEINDSLAMEIVSAHRVPPLLAQILIAGKMGAANEMVNSLMSFQLLVIAPFQNTFSAVLRNTLGDAAKSGLVLNTNDLSLATILDEMDLGQMDTTARMRQPLMEAQDQGRDLNKGIKRD